MITPERLKELRKYREVIYDAACCIQCMKDGDDDAWEILRGLRHDLFKLPYEWDNLLDEIERLRNIPTMFGNQVRFQELKELRKENEDLRFKFKLVDANNDFLLEENAKLRKALKFYAEGGHWREDYVFDGKDEQRIEVICDKGELARKVLEAKTF